MSSLGREIGTEIARTATRLTSQAIERELDYWRYELTLPWNVGRRTKPAKVGRWIGAGLAAGAFVFGVVSAVRTEKLRR